MKKFAISLAAVAMIATSAPAVAQSANDMVPYDQARDPGYQSAVRSTHRYYGSYGNNYAGSYGAPVVVVRDQQEGTCVLGGLLFCTRHSAKRPRAGQTCHDSNGVLFGLNRLLEWYRVPGSDPSRMAATHVAADCPWSSYHANSEPD